MASYDNSRYTYAEVLAGNGYFMKDDNLTPSTGVLEMQSKLNRAGFWCGTPDGKFGAGTDEAVRHFQRMHKLTLDGKAGKNTLLKLDQISSTSSGFTKTSGTYGIYFDSTKNRFMHNQQVVYDKLRSAGLSKKDNLLSKRVKRAAHMRMMVRHQHVGILLKIIQVFPVI